MRFTLKTLIIGHIIAAIGLFVVLKIRTDFKQFAAIELHRSQFALIREELMAIAESMANKLPNSSILDRHGDQFSDDDLAYKATRWHADIRWAVEPKQKPLLTLPTIGIFYPPKPKEVAIVNLDLSAASPVNGICMPIVITDHGGPQNEAVITRLEEFFREQHWEYRKSTEVAPP